jgi:hypothetical protein
VIINLVFHLVSGAGGSSGKIVSDYGLVDRKIEVRSPAQAKSLCPEQH